MGSEVIETEKGHGVPSKLIDDIRKLIEDTRRAVAFTVNAGLSMLHWQIGRRINKEVLGNTRGDYGKQILATLAQQLGREYGKGFSYSALTRMVRFAEIFPEKEIVVSLMQELSWTHFIALIPLKDPLQREFYAEMCRVEGWSVRALRKKMDSMLYERTAISRKPEETVSGEIAELRDRGKMSPENEMTEGDNPAVGILLCTQKNHALVRYALAGMSNQLFVSRYQLELPRKEQIEQLIREQMEELGYGE